jgi:hypothetical protein
MVQFLQARVDSLYLFLREGHTSGNPTQLADQRHAQNLVWSHDLRRSKTVSRSGALLPRERLLPLGPLQHDFRELHYH